MNRGDSPHPHPKWYSLQSLIEYQQLHHEQSGKSTFKALSSHSQSRVWGGQCLFAH